MSEHGTWYCRRINRLTGQWEVSRPFRSRTTAEREFKKRIYTTNKGQMVFGSYPGTAGSKEE